MESIFQYSMPILGFVSGSVLHIAMVDLYNSHFSNEFLLYTFNLKRLNNISGYIGFLLGINYLYKGKPLLENIFRLDQ